MITGKFFHTFLWDESAGWGVQWQGRVVDYNPEDNAALVLLFSWWDGSPTGQRLTKVSEDWVFYDTDEEMTAAYIAMLPASDQEYAEKMNALLRKGAVVL